MSINLLSETIDGWMLKVLECEDQNDRERAEQVRNWLFGAGMALLLLDDPALLYTALRALEASENGINRNRTVGAGPGDNLGISGVDSQREDMARATRCPRTAGADGGA